MPVKFGNIYRGVFQNQISMMELFAKMIAGLKTQTIFPKSYIEDILLSSTYTSEVFQYLKFKRHD